MNRPDSWRLAYDGVDPATEGRREALCTLGNGYLATRGAAPEYGADGVHYPGTYVASCYNRLRDVTSGQEVENESLVNVPNWLPLTFRGGDGPWLGQEAVDVLSSSQVLDLRRGVLTRRLRVRDPAGRTTDIVQQRFVHMRHMHLCGLRTTLVPLDWSGTMHVRSYLDGSVANTGVARYQNLSSRHLEPVTAEVLDAQTALLVVQTTQSHIRIAQAMRTRLWCAGSPAGANHTAIEGGGLVGHEFAVDVRPATALVVEKLVSVFTSRDGACANPAVEAVTQLGWVWTTGATPVPGAGDFDALLAEQALAWQMLWRRFRFSLRGSETVARVIRLHLFHLLQTISPNSVDLDAGVPARGLHGEAYRGHVLWDELFVFPILNPRLSLLTRSLLRYRYRRLPWARQAARAAGHTGAAYPWQSGSDGREESQRLHLNPNSGRWVADVSHRQRHIGLAVAYNVWHYYQVSGDGEFLFHYGAEMILEIARFFASLASYDPDLGRYVIRGVMGPDEFHTGYPGGGESGIDNNAYTNVLAVWVLLRAQEVLALLPAWRRGELAATLGMSPDEPHRWSELTRRMYVPVHGDGIISQFEGYERLRELDWTAYRARYGDIRRLDRILEAEHDTPNNYKVSKQADVLMLFYLFSAEELRELLQHLGYQLRPDFITANIDYYLARTTHGSTLSAVVHAWVLARCHRDRAVEYFVQALDADLADIQGGTTAEGIHLAAMAGAIDVLQRCFAGVETRGDCLWLNPHWPAQLGTLEFDLHYRGHALTLSVSGYGVRVRAGAGLAAPIHLHCRGQRALLRSGEAVEFRHDPSQMALIGPTPARGRDTRATIRGVPPSPDMGPGTDAADAGRGAHTPVAHLLNKAAEEAGLAPSILNTQPWRWRIDPRPDGDVLELYADPTRLLNSIDPTGRLLTLSCGATLHHARAALAAAGHEPVVTRFPDPGQPLLMAQIRVGGAHPVRPEDVAIRAGMRRRHSDRRPFASSEPVPEEAIDALRSAAEAEQVDLHRVEADQVSFLASAAEGAHLIEAKDPRYRTELGEWTHRPRDTGDGVPPETLVPATSRPVPIRPFAADEEAALPAGPGDDRLAEYLVLATQTDAPVDWLRSGEATSSVWLTATTLNLAVSVLSEVVEVGGARALLRGLLHPPASPQLVLRVGVDRQQSPPPATPRRSA